MALTNETISGNIVPQNKVTMNTPSSSGSSLNLPSGGAPTTASAGDMWNDSTQLSPMFSFIGGANVQSALMQVPKGCGIGPQTANTTITTIQVMGTLPFSTGAGAGFQNAVGKFIVVKGHGFYTTAGGQTPQITITLKWGTVVLSAVQSAATTASATNMPFQFEFVTVVLTTGSSGTVECQGTLRMTLGTTPAAASSLFLDTNTATVTVDNTAANDMTINITATSTLSSATLRDAIAYVGN